MDFVRNNECLVCCAALLAAWIYARDGHNAQASFRGVGAAQSL